MSGRPSSAAAPTGMTRNSPSSQAGAIGSPVSRAASASISATQPALSQGRPERTSSRESGSDPSRCSGDIASNAVSTWPEAAYENRVTPLTFQNVLTARVPCETRRSTSGRDPCQPLTSTAKTHESTPRTATTGSPPSSSAAWARLARRDRRRRPPRARATWAGSPDLTKVTHAASPMTVSWTQENAATSAAPSGIKSPFLSAAWAARDCQAGPIAALVPAEPAPRLTLPVGRRDRAQSARMCLLGERVPCRWLDTGTPQRPRHEVALGVGVGVAVTGMLPGEPVLQAGVLAAQPGIGAQRVPERQQRQRVGVPVLDQVQVMRPRLRPGAQKPQPVVTARVVWPEEPARPGQHW